MTGSAVVAAVFREEGPRVLATLIRSLGDMDLAEEAMQEAFVTALERWPTSGLPDNAAAWITTTARNRALDRIRREAKRDAKHADAHRSLGEAWQPEPPADDTVVGDDRLRLVFTCCHPVLPREQQVALALRTLCGLTTVEVARAFHVPEATMAQRLVRAKRRIANARIAYRVPADHELPARLVPVVAVVRTIFTEGHASAAPGQLVRPELCDEAIRLARVLAELLPDEGEALALLALLLLTDARRATRLDAAGDVVLLADQDRARWDHEAIREGVCLTERALRQAGGHPGAVALQAAIAGCHALAPTHAATDWAEIAELYGLLEAIDPTPAVIVNRAVAVAEVAGPAAGLAVLDRVDGAAGWHLLHAVRADLLTRLGDQAGAAGSLAAALACHPSDPERRLLQARLAALVP